MEKDFVSTALPLALQKEVALHLDRYRERAGQAKQAALSVSELPQELPHVWACSPFVASYCCHDPSRLRALVESGDLRRRYPPTEFAERLGAALASHADDALCMRKLRQFRNREMVRIAWRDICGLADLHETMRDLSLLAQACLEQTLSIIHQGLTLHFGTPKDQHGKAQTMTIIGMGKLGAFELNFSSDIDLIFTYRHSGDTVGGSRTLSNQEFFTRLGKRLIKILDQVTDDGFVFRVDMRLRPFGDSGPLVMNINALEEYYQGHARDWERYAMIKGRVVAGGDDTLLMDMLRPFVYRRYLDFGAIDAIRKMKEMIDDEVARKGMHQDIKLGPGGIREIEFIGQTFQLIHGGRQPTLQVRGILPVLSRLSELGMLPPAAVKELRDAYVFLRHTEHRLQQVNDQQTQSLPTQPMEQRRIALGMGFTAWDDFSAALEKHRSRVARHFAELLQPPSARAHIDTHDRLASIWRGSVDKDSALDILRETGMADPASAYEAIQKLRLSPALRRLTHEARDRLDQLMPLLIPAISKADQQTATMTRVFNIIEPLLWRSTYLALLSENPQALAQLIKLCAASPWFSNQIARQPILLDELLDPRELYAPPAPSELAPRLRALLETLPEDDLERRMESLRQFKNAQVLRVAAADIAGSLPVAEVSNHLSAIAEAAVTSALDMAGTDLAKRHGQPTCVDERGARLAGFSIIAYGKLGGLELGYGSDLDLVFLHDSRREQQITDGRKPMENTVFFSRLAQRIIHYLTTMTPSGKCYEIDTRLRPSGASGLLVSSLAAYDSYQREQAWTWEHQALVRARAIAGAPNTSKGFAAIRRQILGRTRAPLKLRREVAEMRARMRRELCNKDPAVFDLKQGPGGITDIEFMVQYAVLRWAANHPVLLEVTDNLRLLQRLGKCGLISEDDCQILHDAYFDYRAHIHRLALQEQPALVDGGAYLSRREGVLGVWQRLIEKPGGD